MALLDKAIKRTGMIQQARLQRLLALLSGKARRDASPPTEQAAEEYILHLLNLLKDSGIYALSSMASPLVALVLAPFLTRYLSRTEYGALAVLNITISLIAAFTQLGMATSFFRAYNWDYEARGDRFAIFTTSLLLLLLVSTPVLIVMYIFAPWLSALLIGSSAFSSALKITALVIFVQNLALPLLLWLRAEKRALLFSLLSICNLLVTLVATLFFVGVLHMGIDGSLLASAGGYLILVLSICPVVFSQLKKGLSMRPRMDITHNLLRFGIPIVFSAVAAWALQLSDRYLLTYLGSLAQTASYTVAYSLGGALAPIILTPFGMAWPPAMYAIAKREDAPRLFRLVFRWYSIVLFLFNFVLSLLGIALLYLLFPPVYRPIAPLIPIISLSYTFYGIYYVVSVGTYIRRKTALIIFFTTSAAGVNILLNFILIPLYGPLGAALATLFAFMLLAAVAYIVNQRLYPLPLEIGIFWLALCIGVGLFVGGVLLARVLPLYLGWAVLLCALILYGICLVALGRLPVRKRGYGQS